ncbi:DUF4916 domain-containing protein [Phytohabitans suffuscus]|uniref:DUF4916 domain-containing protein n=1 Tax=Phytohabitans suffuscus TaxID=624315 RepID=A0A6F8YX28_9ACTN|nr:DUF4916 domain-containing protein [Phytohabitans suffuscus]BCB90652.1 hypothetical protein Psuf_079650 [Phytohabitans suffuscus]
MTDIVGAGDRWIPAEEYARILARVPIACVDLLPLSAGPRPRVGLIHRDTPAGPGWCLVGGAVLRNETLAAAVGRHLVATLGAGVSVAALAYATTVEYFPEPGLGDFRDPRKHSISHTYTGVCAGTAAPAGEADRFEWFAVDRLPAEGEFGFGQGRVVARVLAGLGLS